MHIEKEPQRKRRSTPDRRYTSLLDRITGAKILQPMILEVMATFHAEGQTELSDTLINQRLRSAHPERHVRIETVCRALDGLEVDGRVTRRHIGATEALEKGIFTGSYYRIPEDNRKILSDSLPQKDPQTK